MGLALFYLWACEVIPELGSRSVKRPFWLDILYVIGFFIPPITTATILTGAVARHLVWSGPVWLLANLVAVVVCLTLWVVGIIVWSRRPGTE